VATANRSDFTVMEPLAGVWAGSARGSKRRSAPALMLDRLLTEA
jgi:hypothetical protein